MASVGSNVSVRNESRSNAIPALSVGVIALLMALKFVVHITTNWRSGYFRTVLYYLYCALHPAWGYASMSPFTTLLAKI